MSPSSSIFSDTRGGVADSPNSNSNGRSVCDHIACRPSRAVDVAFLAVRPSNVELVRELSMLGVGELLSTHPVLERLEISIWKRPWSKPRVTCR